MTIRCVLPALVGLSLLASACGKEAADTAPDTTATGGGGGEHDGSGGQQSGSGGDSGGEAGAPIWSDKTWSPDDTPDDTSDLPPEVMDTRSFIPEDVTVEAATANTKYPIIAGNLFMDEDGRLLWLAILRNDAAWPLCSVIISGSARRGDDSQAYLLSAAVAGAVFDNGLGEESECIAPGDTAVVTWTVLSPHAEGVEEIASISYSVEGYLNPDASPDDSVVFTNLAVSPTSEGAEAHRITGKVSATRSVQYFTIAAYPLNAGGAPLAELLDVPLSGTLSAGASADMETTSYPGLFESYHFSPSYSF